jgi:hypothetical protein
MAITYPLSLPSHTGIRSASLRAVNAVAVERSPFTFSGQAQASAGQMWQADIQLPPMKYEDAEQWTAWLVSLRGQFGTFTMGDPARAIARGTARGTDTVTVNGGSQTGQDLNITSDQTSETGYLKAGDYIQLGSGSSATLHKVLVDASTDGSGNATVTMWPSVRIAPANGSTVVVQNAVGRWRLASNESEWSIDEATIYGISFSAMEAIG